MERDLQKFLHLGDVHHYLGIQMERMKDGSFSLNKKGKVIKRTC